MEKLLTSLQTDSQFRRQLSLLRILGNTKEAMRTKALADAIAATPPTIRQDIMWLNQNSNGNFMIHSVSTEGFYMKLADNQSIDSVVNELIKQTLAYRIVQSIFNQEKNYEHLLHKNKISKSKFTRAICHINEVLHDFQISISIKKWMFIGKEENIRLFFFYFYSELGEMPCTFAELEAYLELVRKNHIELFGDNLPMDTYSISLWLSITQIRWKQKQYVHIKQSLREILPQKEMQPIHMRLFESMTNTEMVKETEKNQNEYAWLSIIAIHSACYTLHSHHDCGASCFNEEEQGQIQSIDWQDVFHKRIYHHLPPNIQEQICRLLHCWLTDKCDTNVNNIFTAFLIAMHLLSQVSPCFEYIEQEVMLHFNQEHDNIYKKIANLLKVRIQEDKEFFLTNTNDISIHLTTLYLRLEKFILSRRIKVLFMLNDGRGIRYGIEQVREIMPRNVELICVLDKGNLENLKNETIDMVISNCEYQPVKGVPHVRISTRPNQGELINIRRNIENLSSR